MATKKTTLSPLHIGTVRVARIHLLLVLAFAIQIIFYDAWHLITLELVMQRWIAIAALLVVTIVVWYLAHTTVRGTLGNKLLLWALIIADIVFASFCVYSGRGMASRAVALYAIPLIASAIMLSRAALLGTAALCIAAYTATAVSYFVINFNEGYKIELYGEVAFYSFGFIIVALLLWAVVRTKKHPHQ